VDDAAAAARQGAEAFFAVWNEEGPEVAADRYWDPGIVWEESRNFPDASVLRGRDAAVARMVERYEVLGRVEIEVVDAEPVGGEFVIEVIARGRGSASGAPVEMREYFVIELAGGLTVRFREFQDRDEARAAASGPDAAGG